MNKVISLTGQFLTDYGRKPIVATFGLGMAAGFPLTFVISLVTIWLSRYEVSLREVGVFAAASSFYSWKFLWSPAIDQISLGPLTRLLGRRRSWLFLIQALMSAALVTVSLFDPKADLYSVGALVALIAFLSASQDIVIDAYRIELVPEEDLAYSASSYIFGYRAANALAGIGVLLVAERLGWGGAIALLPLLFVPSVVGALVVGEPEIEGRKQKKAGLATEEDTEEDTEEGVERSAALYTPVPESFFKRAVILPFQDFMQRDYWALILLFILFFKAGDAVTAIMTGPLLVDMGYSDSDIAYANKAVGLIALLVGTAMGAVLYKQARAYKALLISGILMMLTNLGFAWLAVGEPLVWRLAVTIGLENFATGLGATVVIAYFSGLCTLHYTATQFALLSSFAGQARALMSVPSGLWAEQLGWFDFFVLATLIGVPGIVLLLFLWRKVSVPKEAL